MQLVIDRRGVTRCLYDEAIDLRVLGVMTIRRASHVEPDPFGAWWADLLPVDGPRLGPFNQRSAALDAERIDTGHVIIARRLQQLCRGGWHISLVPTESIEGHVDSTKLHDHVRTLGNLCDASFPFGEYRVALPGVRTDAERPTHVI